jgi:hypothetical protein
MSDDEPLEATRFQRAAPAASPEDESRIWASLVARLDSDGARPDGAAGLPHPMEGELVVLEALDELPRTPRSGWIARSSPLAPDVREMFEERRFGRPFDAVPFDPVEIPADMPPLACPAGDVPFLASDRSFDELNLSVDCLLAHRRRLIAASVDADRPRRRVLVLGAGPGGLMTAIELALRGHSVVVCEARESYTRNRFIGVYKEVAHLMAALGMPESMTYDFTHYRGKRGLMLADIQTFLHGIALKLGVVVYTGATTESVAPPTLRSGEVVLRRSASAGVRDGTGSTTGMTRWCHSTIARVRSGVPIRFDTVIEATGGRSGLRESIVGPDNVVSLRTLARDAAELDPSLGSYFGRPGDRCADIIRPTSEEELSLLDEFAHALRSGDDASVPDRLPCFVSNIDASIFNAPIRAVFGDGGARAKIDEHDLDIPPDWVIVECPLVDRTLTRYQIEGPLPAGFEFGGASMSTAEALPNLNPVGFLLRALYAMGVPFEAVDRKKLIDFYTVEGSSGDARSVVATFVGEFRGLRVGGAQPVVWGVIPGSDSIEYGFVGEALQNAWYRFGVGVDDTFAVATRLADSFELDDGGRLQSAMELEQQTLARGVQVLFHLYQVTRDPDQGVVGGVLSDHHLDDQYGHDLSAAHLRNQSRSGAEIAQTWRAASARDALLGRSLEQLLAEHVQRALVTLASLGYERATLDVIGLLVRPTHPNWMEEVASALLPVLSSSHAELVAPMLDDSEATGTSEHDRELQLVELAMGRQRWSTPWTRACALRALDPGSADTNLVIEQATGDPDPLVSETGAALARDGAAPGRGHLTVDKVAILARVGIFTAVPLDSLAEVASLVSEHRIDAGHRVVSKGDPGGSLYIVASGRLRVHDGEVGLNEVAEHDVFGELSLLDGEATSASVTALTPTTLLRLDHADFDALLLDHVDIVLAINRALCRMVRREAAVGRGAEG